MKKLSGPLFDTLEHIHKNHEYVILEDPQHYKDFVSTIAFLKSYTGSLGTFNSYRREVERLLQWCWHVQHKQLSTLNREDIEHFIRFCQNPPVTWRGTKKVPRFVNAEGLRKPNAEWRPFVVHISKARRQLGDTPDVDDFELSSGAVQEVLAILSTFFNFLIADEYVSTNPVALIRQKSKFVRKRQAHAPIRRLSCHQWEVVVDVTEQLAKAHPARHERTLFMLSLLFGLYLRISELAASPRWIPQMNDFAKDHHGSWWFTTVGKGHKERQITVSDDVLKSLMRWRTFLNKSPLPSPSDTSPLLPKQRGTGPLSDTAPIRRIIQQCFDLAEATLRSKGHAEEADHLASATVHWLRHTGISEDVKIRPREHVRDDAGHASSATTDRYIDVEKQARHRSGRHKRLIPVDDE